MNIAIIGYGKMGRAIERIARERNITIAAIAKSPNELDNLLHNKSKMDVAIEFTSPESAPSNIAFCINNHIPVVSGTTGWLDDWVRICRQVEDLKGSLFYASNYSLGVNLFFAINQHLARLMSAYPDYKAEIEEIHHTAKLDKPSGTAISLAEDIIDASPSIHSWRLHEEDLPNDMLAIKSKRTGSVYGDHYIRYISDVDQVEIRHEAFTRDGFAIGAITAAQWLIGKKGVFGMKNMLGL